MGEEWTEEEIPAEMKAAAEEAHHQLIDVVSNHDDIIMEKYLGDEEITPEDLQRAIRTATLGSHAVPILCGSAFKNKGVQPMLDAVVDYLPSPLDIPPTMGTVPRKEGVTVERPPDDTAPFAALAFKIMTDPYVGKLTYLRVYSGTLTKGSGVMNSTKDRKERIGRILQMHANSREDLDATYAGDIVAAVGLKQTTTGDTLCDPDHQVVLESLTFPEPVIHVAVEPKTKADQDKLSQGPVLAVRGGPDLPGPVRRGDRPDGHLGDGRAPPRGAGGPDDAGVQRRRQRGQAPGGLPRDHPQEGREGRVPLRPPDRRQGPVRPRGHHPRAQSRPGATSSWTRSPAG